MRQTIEREVLQARFIPNTEGAPSATGVRDDRRGEPQLYVSARNELSPSRESMRTHGVARTWRRVASTVFWAVAGERAFARAVSQTRLPAALLHGSLAAGTVYMQERVARDAGADPLYGASRRSLFSFYAVIGFGLGLGAMLVNRRRG